MKRHQPSADQAHTNHETSCEGFYKRGSLDLMQSHVGMATVDAFGRFTDVNPALTSILGRTDRELLGRELAFITDGSETSARLAESVTSPSGQAHTTEMPVLKPDGTEVWILVTTTWVSDTEANGYWAMQVQDVTRRVGTETALSSLALLDPLTGLPNHALLRERVSIALADVETRVALVYLSLNRFRHVNDSLGQAAGDRLLAMFAQRLQEWAPTSTVARVGGDIFAVVLTLTTGPEGITTLVEDYLQRPENHNFELNNRLLYVEFSAGIAMAAPFTTAEDLLRNADIAMSQAKEAGDGRAVAFHETHLESLRARLALENDLRHAIHTSRIQVVYQPIVTTKDQRVIAAEALARWRSDEHGDVAPEIFIPLSCRLGLNFQLTSQVLRSVCSQVARWRSNGDVAQDFRVSVNLSAEDVTDARLVDEVVEGLTTARLDPSALCLEVTETGFVRDTDAALENLRALRRLGVRTAVDDFGTGYSSLSYLNMFPVDAVKIDKSFIAGLGRDANATSLVRGILSLTGAMGLAAVAEGVENDLQLEALRDLGCLIGQGYYWARPVPADQFLEVLESRRPVIVDAPAASAGRHWQTDERDSHLGWAVVDALPTSVAVLAADGTVLATNLAWKRFALGNGGDSAHCGTGTNYLDVCRAAIGQGAEDATLAARGLAAVLGGDTDQFALEYDCNSPSERRRYLMLVSPVASGPGAAVVAHLDITARHLAQLAQADSEASFRGIFEQAPIGILRWGDDGRVADANPALCELSGLTRQELLDTRREDLFEDDPVQAGAWTRETSTRQTERLALTRSSQRKMRRPDGVVRVVQVNDVMVVGTGADGQTLLATVEDITERLEVAEDLRRAREMEALGRLAGGIAHEINTPTQFISDNLSFLTSIWEPVAILLARSRAVCLAAAAGEPIEPLVAAMTEACRSADVDYALAEVPQALSQSLEGVERVASIVRAMKAFGHPDGLEPELTDVNRLVADTITVARNELKYVADVVCEQGALPLVLCYQGAIGQVVLNLLVNAAYAIGKAEEAKGQHLGQVTVRTWEEDRFACIEVADTGNGIPPEVQPHIFEPFFTTKPIGQGTGQGLAMAWATIVERHRGLIDVSTSNSGTTFIIKLPLAPTDPAPVSLSATAAR